MKINDIRLNPKNPRIIKDFRYEKLKKSIGEFPKMMELRPIIVDNDGVIIGGNMRYKAITDLGYKELPDNWVKKASELTDEERERFIIVDNVAFGENDYDVLANEYDQDELIGWGMELPLGGEAFDKVKELYSKKIVAPIYEPSGEIPNVSELVDGSKVVELLKCIDESDIDESVKAFLRIAAVRHFVFNYARIADYYAGSDKKMQGLMEKLALVIIDFKKAIENGYVKLSQSLLDQYLDDYDERK